uniref:Uncharacterized protein n=1 Tax=Spongospora subterranea TaxID=70186 RepID=A0A0H5QS28_9EUKA|eukprot:CRZ04472.1 hypothetical protein [Spongospora subterranea]
MMLKCIWGLAIITMATAAVDTDFTDFNVPHSVQPRSSNNRVYFEVKGRIGKISLCNPDDVPGVSAEVHLRKSSDHTNPNNGDKTRYWRFEGGFKVSTDTPKLIHLAWCLVNIQNGAEMAKIVTDVSIASS